MTHGSLFTGIGGFDLAADRVGIETLWQCDFDPKCRETLAAHWPNIERIHDVRKIGPATRPVDLVTGGFPCQDLSVAGRRAGLAGERSGLWHEYERILGLLKPRWVVVENVPGLLSSNRGRDFAVVLRGLVELGYGVCWRILDAQYFGLAQRRKRVFIVGSLGDFSCSEVLFEPESVSGYSAPGRKEGAEVAAVLDCGAKGRGFRTEPGEHIVAHTLSCPISNARYDPNGEDYVISGLTTSLGHHGWSIGNEDFSKLRTDGVGVRRLTPTECERLQGFPDGWTAMHKDTVRYRQLGNAVAVPVAEWILRRIAKKLLDSGVVEA